MEAWSLNHWTTREFTQGCIFLLILGLLRNSIVKLHPALAHGELTGHVGWRYHLLLLPVSSTMNCLCLPSKFPCWMSGGAEGHQRWSGMAECRRRWHCLWPGPHHGWAEMYLEGPTWTSRPTSSPTRQWGPASHRLREHVEEEGGVFPCSRDVLGLPLLRMLCFSKEWPDHHLSPKQSIQTSATDESWGNLAVSGVSFRHPAPFSSPAHTAGATAVGLNSRLWEGLTSLPLFQIQNPHQALFPALSQVPTECPAHVSQPVSSCGPVGEAPVGSEKQNKRQMGWVPWNEWGLCWVQRTPLSLPLCQALQPPIWVPPTSCL